MLCYVLLLALVAQGWSHPPGKPDGSAVFRPPPPPPKGTGLPPPKGTGLPPPKGTGLPPPVSHDLKNPLGHPEEIRTGAPLSPRNPPNEHGRHKRHLDHGKVAPTGVPHHTGVHSNSGEISHPPRPDHSAIPHKPHNKPEHGRHRRDLHRGKADPTGVPHHTEESYSGEISHPPKPDHSAFTHNDKSSEKKRPGHGPGKGKKH
ncbi:protein XA-1-like isoform X2 [Xenopus laevis]|uniref:Uncharacterized protein n=2 Tax=Xenopus laevis TaxID=8355 RepID=A0A974CIS4_XENLA|nr:protein XA-1-like isoform X2 [Xenopus laevis]OCT72971.1 hypothetical protein XELAEV_18035952mg [Xenopus laevis]